MGANLILKYTGEKGENCPFKAVSALCTPFNIEKCSKFLRSNYSLAALSDRFLTYYLTNLVKNQEHCHDDWTKMGIDLNDALKSQRTLEYDYLITCKILGYKDPEEYYKDNSCEKVLHNIKIPVLALSSRDDPVVTSECIPFDIFTSNPNLILAITKYGGHIG